MADLSDFPDQPKNGFSDFPDQPKPKDSFSTTARKVIAIAPTAIKQAASSLLPPADSVPEFIGSMAGQFVRKSPLGVAAAGGGAAGGEAMRQIFMEKEPLTMGERGKKLGGAFLRGAFGEGIGRGLGFALAPFAKSVTPEVKAGMEAANKEGIELPLSAMSESPFVQATERSAEYSLFGPKVTARRKAAVDGLESLANRISDGISPDAPAELVGDMANAKVKVFEEGFRKAKNAIYEPINIVLKDKPVNPENTIAAIKTVLERKAGGKEGQGLLKDWLKRLQPEGKVQGTTVKESLDPLTGQVVKYNVPATKTTTNMAGVSSSVPAYETTQPAFKVLKAIRTEIGSRGNFGDPGVQGMKADLEFIYSQASKDMDNVASQYGMKDALDKANAVYSKGIKKLQDSLVKAVTKRAEKSPESLHKLLIRNDSPTLIKTGREILGNDGFNQVRKQWFDDLVNRSKSIIDGEEVISPQKLATNIKKLGSSFDAMVSDNPQLKEKILNMANIAKALTRGNKVTQGSQTGFILQNLLDARNLIAAPLVQTETGRRFLTTGFPTFGKIVRRSAQPVIQGTLQSATADNE